MLHLVQLRNESGARRVAVVEGDTLRLLREPATVYDLALAAIDIGNTLESLAKARLGGESLKYDDVYTGRGAWRLLPPVDHPADPARCVVAGTGLTHVASAKNRQAMHAASGAAKTDAPVTDSMRMFQWGVEGGKPGEGKIGVQPEWFWKGPGDILRAHGQPLEVPAFADDGGEEPEVVGLYLIDKAGQPRRIGFAIGNEFSDHVMEKKNYLYLAPSKLRQCAIGPELVVGHPFDDVKGNVSVLRGGKTVWSAAIRTGEKNMSHALANLEHHHFKYPQHRRSGDVHVHFFGADAFSFGAGVALQDGDVMEVAWEGFGRPLRNPIRVDRSTQPLVRAVAV